MLREATSPGVRSRRALSPAVRLWVLAAVALALCAAYLTVDVAGDVGFVLRLRGTRILGMVLVGFAIALSTVLFQTVTTNRILTPSVMGFDSLYLLIQTVLVFALGSRDVSAIDPVLRFAFEVGLMVLLAGLLYRWLFAGARRSLHLLVLVGIVFGVLFRSLSSFMQRLLDPNEFAVLQDAMFASFTTIDPDLMFISAVCIAAAATVVWPLLHRLDVLALGREMAVGLGVDHRGTVSLVLVLVAVLVSVSTALVGPITFFGLLVANLAYLITGSAKHAYLIPVASLLSVIALVGGQLALERIFALDTALSIIIEFLGGIVFIFILLRGVRR